MIEIPFFVVSIFVGWLLIIVNIALEEIWNREKQSVV